MLQSLFSNARSLATSDEPFVADMHLAFVCPHVSAIYNYWRSKAQGERLPGRPDIDPIDLGGSLRYVVLVDVEAAPRRYRYRLVGTHSTEMLDRDFTGRYLDEVYAPNDLQNVSDAFERVIRERAPIRYHGAASFAQKHYLQFEAAVMPLAGDGETVDMLLLGVCYDTLRPPPPEFGSKLSR